MNWCKGQSLQHDHPTITRGEWRQLLEGKCHKPRAKIIGWARACLGWLSSNFECSHDATHVDGSPQVIHPVLHFSSLATLECCTQQFTLFVQRSILHERWVIRACNDCPQIAQVDSFKDFLDGFDAVMPFGNPQARQHFHYQIDEAVRVDFWLAVFYQLCILFVHGLSHRPDAASEGLFGQHTFFGLERHQHRFAMGVLRMQASRPRTLGQFGWGRSELTTRNTRSTGSTGVSRPAIVAALI